MNRYCSKPVNRLVKFGHCMISSVGCFSSCKCSNCFDEVQFVEFARTQAMSATKELDELMASISDLDIQVC